MTGGPLRSGAHDVRGDDDASVAASLARAALALARRLAGGATMWCVAPTWPAHGRHVAVEFVHPVILGKRALPAVHVGGPDVTGQVRANARPGDVLLVVGPAGDDTVSLVRRAAAWGLTTMWLGAGDGVPGTVADHVVRGPSPDGAAAAASGDLVVLYHVLWELTHVVLEHPGALSAPEPDDAVCTTCSDEGTVAEVLHVLNDGRAEVVADGLRRIVDVSLVDDVGRGALVLVHAGTALAMVERAP